MFSARAAGNFTDNLVARNHFVLFRRQFSFDNVKIGAADATGTHPKQNVSSLDLRICDLSDSQRRCATG